MELNYSSDGTGAIYRSADNYLDKFSYGSARTVFNTPGANFYERLKENIRKNQPVQLQLASAIVGGKAHSVVVDGYNDVTGQYHINDGQFTAEDWYPLPDGFRDYKHVTYAIMDINPYQGWHQYGADERNTFRAIYPAPVEDVMKDKWSATCQKNRLSFEGLVVASGNRIFATASTISF